MASFRNILGYYRPYWKVAVLSTLGISAFQLIDLLPPYAMGQILNTLSGQPVDGLVQGLTSKLGGLWQGDDRSLTFAVLLLLIFLTTVARAPIQPWLSSWLSWSTALQARRDHFQKSLEKLLSLPLSYYDDNNAGRIAGLIGNGIANHTWAYGELAGQLIPKLFRLLGIFLIVLSIDWRIAAALLISFVFILSTNFRGLRAAVERNKRVEKYKESIDSRTSEIITNIKTVKAFASEESELQRQCQRLEREYKVLHHRVHRSFVNLNVRQNTLIQLCVFSVLSFTLYAAIQRQISLGHFITTFTVTSMAYAELGPINSMSEVLARRYVPMLRFQEFMHQPVGHDSVDLRQSDAQPAYRFTGKVHLINLTFGYEPEHPVLEGVNLLIKPCETVALVGRSGSGKSTLTKLLFRYFDPTSGQILIDGDDIRRLDVAAYRKRLAIVHQEVDVFNGTVLSNLTYGNPEASFEQVRAACRIAKADEFIQQLPEGYFTMVGERGMRLSGGQRQRLGIARALLVDPDVLIFDEATSSLDSESEQAIQAAMRSILGTRTTIMIAHRLSTIREADRIIVLDQGKIAEMGTHEELLQHHGLYAKLHWLQQGEAMELCKAV